MNKSCTPSLYSKQRTDVIVLEVSPPKDLFIPFHKHLRNLNVPFCLYHNMNV